MLPRNKVHNVPHALLALAAERVLGEAERLALYRKRSESPREVTSGETEPDDSLDADLEGSYNAWLGTRTTRVAGSGATRP